MTTASWWYSLFLATMGNNMNAYENRASIHYVAFKLNINFRTKAMKVNPEKSRICISDLNKLVFLSVVSHTLTLNPYCSIYLLIYKTSKWEWQRVQGFIFISVMNCSLLLFFLLYIYDFSIRIQLWACMMTSLSCLNGAATDICAPKLQKHRNKKRKNTPKNEFTHQPNK